MDPLISPVKYPWIRAGYALFAQKGPDSLKVEVLAKLVSVSKSSFYHHFADLDGFVECLLTYHLERVRHIADLERACLNLVPDLLNVLLTVEEDLLFNRQLRSHRATPAFRQCVQTTDRAIANALLPQWIDAFGLADRPQVARVLLNLVIDNFYLQLTGQPFTYQWLLNYMNELRQMVQAMSVEK